jgi:hypothetical protein
MRWDWISGDIYSSTNNFIRDYMVTPLRRGYFLSGVADDMLLKMKKLKVKGLICQKKEK